jgi:DNA-directed RNA polymerase subunit RPC12/RpoP
MSEDEEIIKRCPKCGSEFIDLDSSREMGLSEITCTDCGYGRQVKKPEDELLKWWNGLSRKRMPKLDDDE